MDFDQFSATPATWLLHPNGATPLDTLALFTQSKISRSGPDAGGAVVTGGGGGCVVTGGRGGCVVTGGGGGACVVTGGGGACVVGGRVVTDDVGRVVGRVVTTGGGVSVRYLVITHPVVVWVHSPCTNPVRLSAVPDGTVVMTAPLGDERTFRLTVAHHVPTGPALLGVAVGSGLPVVGGSVVSVLDGDEVTLGSGSGPVVPVVVGVVVDDGLWDTVGPAVGVGLAGSVDGLGCGTWVLTEAVGLGTASVAHGWPICVIGILARSTAMPTMFRQVAVAAILALADTVFLVKLVIISGALACGATSALLRTMGVRPWDVLALIVSLVFFVAWFVVTREVKQTPQRGVDVA